MPRARMAHPKDRPGLTRRRLLQGAAGGAVGVGALGVLAGCENTTTPIGACAGGTARRTSSSRSRSARAACRCRAPTTASPGRSRTTTSRSPTASPTRTGRSGLQLPGLPLSRPRQAVREADRPEGRARDLQLVRRGDREARVGRGRLRRDHRPVRLEHRQPDRPAAAPAAQPLVPAEPGEEHLARAAGPVLRPRQPLHGAVRRLVGRDRLAQRQDRRRHRRDGRPLGHLLAVAAVPRQGRTPRRQARRARDADAARRDACGDDDPTSTPRTSRSSSRRARISASSPTSPTSR